MPGPGRVEERDYTPDERAALLAPGLLAAPLGLLGERTIDVYLNDHACWRNIPERVWAFTLGGYPVLKKWLSYREKSILGRDLEVEEARTFTQIARRVAALLLIGPELDTSYRVCAATAAQAPG
jgi:hypothetical protein